jgi:hypothetical protein
MVHYRNCQTLRRHIGSKQVAHAQEQLQVGGGEFQVNVRLICFMPDLWVLVEGITLRSTRGAPLGRKGCILELASCRCLALGPSKIKRFQRQPHTLDHLPRFSSPGHYCSLARYMHMQATQHDGGPQSASC